uniref:Uncharacterized protein n=1 Tax=Romanomermis culicivorax TaxID=13658 RepID=A0A915J483_ROMCU
MPISSVIQAEMKRQQKTLATRNWLTGLEFLAMKRSNSINVNFRNPNTVASFKAAALMAIKPTGVCNNFFSVKILAKTGKA